MLKERVDKINLSLIPLKDIPRLETLDFNEFYIIYAHIQFQTFYILSRDKKCVFSMCFSVAR